MSRYRDWKLDCKVYVGDLGHGAAKHELEDAFSKYGRLRNVWVARNPPGFAFVEFEDPRDAEDAVHAMDGARLNGRRVRVEMSSGKPRRGGRRPLPPSRGSTYSSGGGRSRRRSRSHSPRRRSRSYSRSRSRSVSRDRHRSASSDRRRSQSKDRGSRLKRRRYSSRSSPEKCSLRDQSDDRNKRRKKSSNSQKSSPRSWSKSKSRSRSNSSSRKRSSHSRSRSRSFVSPKEKNGDGENRTKSLEECDNSINRNGHPSGEYSELSTEDQNESTKTDGDLDNSLGITLEEQGSTIDKSSTQEKCSA